MDDFAPAPAQGPLQLTPYQLACRFMGVREVAGALHNPLVVAMLRLDAKWVDDDETPWCSAFVNSIAWLLELPRSNSVAARSWLIVGESIPLGQALVGFDVVVLSRGSNPASGHVGFYAGHSARTIQVLGGNQGDRVSIQSFDVNRLLGIRRLRPTRRISDHRSGSSGD